MELLAVIIFFIAIILIVIKIYPSLKKWEEEQQSTTTPTTGAPTAPATAQKFPVGTIIGVIVFFVIAIALIFGVIIPFTSDLGNYNENLIEFTQTVSSYSVTQNLDGSVTLAVDAASITEVLISYSEGQKITFIASGTVTGVTNPYDGAYKYIGPEGWSYEPCFLSGRKKFLQVGPFMGLLGKLEGDEEWFYIGKSKTIIAKTSGEKISLGPNEALIDKDGTYHPEWMTDNGGRYIVTIKIQ